MQILATFNGKHENYNSLAQASEKLGFSKSWATKNIRKNGKYTIKRGKNKGTIITVIRPEVEYILQVNHGAGKGQYWYDSISMLLEDLGISKNDKSAVYRIRYVGLYNDDKGNTVYAVQG